LKPIGLGIIGLGAQGKLSLCNSLRLNEARVAGVADVSKTALSYARKKGVKNVYTNYADLLRNNEIDAVVINLPNFLHLEGAINAAEAGKHVLLEKPLARTVEEGEKIVSSARKNGVKLMVGYDMRFNPVFRKIHDEIVDGFFGSVRIAEATNVGGGPFSPRNDSMGPVKVPAWWFDKKLTGGGALLDLGSHLVNLLIWYFGEVLQAESHLDHIFKMDLEDAATCVLRFKQGTVATAHVGWFSKTLFESLQICGTAGNKLIQIYPRSTLRTAWTGIGRSIGVGDDTSFLKVKHFVDSLQNDEQPQPSGEEGLYDLRVISIAYRNALK